MLIPALGEKTTKDATESWFSVFFTVFSLQSLCFKFLCVFFLFRKLWNVNGKTNTNSLLSKNCVSFFLLNTLQTANMSLIIGPTILMMSTYQTLEFLSIMLVHRWHFHFLPQDSTYLCKKKKNNAVVLTKYFAGVKLWSSIERFKYSRHSLFNEQYVVHWTV